MSKWRVESISVAALEPEDAAFFGINQTQTHSDAKMASGAFYTEVWSADKSRRLVHDLDRGLPPAGSYEPHLVQAADMPSGPAMVNCFYSETGSDERLGECWQEIAMPETGWAGHKVKVMWQAES